jgi:hypothetical protein
MQPQPARAPIAALSDVESFLLCAQTLKATTLELRARQQRESALQRTLATQIAAMTRECESMASKSAKLRDMWKLVKAELAQDAAATGDEEHGDTPPN